MIDDLRPYPAMKDSGGPWLGDAPAHWEVLPNRVLFVRVVDREHVGHKMPWVAISTGGIRRGRLPTNVS
jgi:type I restriction enzyme S subunit